MTPKRHFERLLWTMVSERIDSLLHNKAAQHSRWSHFAFSHHYAKLGKKKLNNDSFDVYKVANVE